MRQNLALLLGGLALVASAPVVAHHSIAGEYDSNKIIALTGTVSKIEWTNPHARLYVDVMQPDGIKTTWNLELTARSALSRQGWTGKTVKIGDTVSFEGEAARSGASGVHARTVMLDGKKVFSGAVD